MRFSLGLVLMIVAASGMTAAVRAQEEKAADPAAAATEPAAVAAPEQKPADAPAAAPSPDEGTTPEFREQIQAWKDLLKQLRELQVRYKVAKPAERAPIEEEYNKLIAQGEAMAPKLLEATLGAYKAHPNKNQEVSQFLISRVDSDIKNDRYQQAFDVAQALIENNFPNPALYELAGTAAFALNDYDAAEKYFKQAEENKALGEQGKLYQGEIPAYREMWAKEQELRAAEAKADDLPRVLLKTTQGDIVLELFENEAPNSVANFIHLVEKGYYNNLSFHRVIHGFMAQGGDPKGDGSGGPGYTIACECFEPNHRNHFAGTLSMAHAGRDTGGSQFFLTFRPTPHLNPSADMKSGHTVFGRVIEGYDNLVKLKTADPQKPGKPDKILEAKVLRKREHEYTPKTKPDAA